MIRTPVAALLLGLLGTIPFVWASLLILEMITPRPGTLPDVLSGDGRLILVRYGGIILPFMSGVLWGFAARAESMGQASAAFCLSVIPALWWFFMPGDGVQSGLINLGIGFLGVLAIDYAFSRWELAPPWWMALRIQLTVVVLICLGIGIWA